LCKLQAFVARADRWLGSPPAAVPDHAVLREMLPELDSFSGPIHGMSLGAGHDVSQRIVERNKAVRQHNRLGIGLTLFLSALTLAFAGLAMRQMRQLQARRHTLESLAHSLREARRDAEAASAAKSAFLANMSHEIRTPFHGLLGMLSLLRSSGLSPRQLDHLRTATESADHLLAILNDVLDMSQLESGRMTLAPTAVDVRALLREVEALMRPQANAKSLALHLDAEPQVPERILADPTRLKQVLFNLLSNAIKFSERGTVVLDVRLLADADGTRQLDFIVTDTGIGMDEATVARLFRRFSQGDATPSRRFGGTGLGLEISRNLARLMGGDITVRSAPGEGSRFAFRLPVRDAPAAPAPAPQSESAAGTPPPRLQVLVAEDHAVNRQYMAALLETLGHDAFFAADGEQALRAVCERRFDLVLMDLHMPRLDGFGATRAIRALPDRAAATVPIVALTADAFPETRDRCLVTGMNAFLTKPVGPDKLATALRRLFGPGVATETAAAETTRDPGPGTLVDTVALERALQAIPRQRFAAMVEAFLQQGVQTVQRLRAAVRDGQPLDVRVHAHAARGAALNLGLPALAATAEALHEGAAHLPAHEVARLVQRYEELLGATRDAAVAVGLLAREALDVARDEG
jgi:two-component system, sensor histidine kinase